MYHLHSPPIILIQQFNYVRKMLLQHNWSNTSRPLVTSMTTSFTSMTTLTHICTNLPLCHWWQHLCNLQNIIISLSLWNKRQRASPHHCTTSTYNTYLSLQKFLPLSTSNSTKGMNKMNATFYISTCGCTRTKLSYQQKISNLHK